MCSIGGGGQNVQYRGGGQNVQYRGGDKMCSIGGTKWGAFYNPGARIREI